MKAPNIFYKSNFISVTVFVCKQDDLNVCLSGREGTEYEDDLLPISRTRTPSVSVYPIERAPTYPHSSIHMSLLVAICAMHGSCVCKPHLQSIISSVLSLHKY